MLTTQEKQLLKEILNDKFAKGAYLGMIYNSSLAHPDLTVVELIKKSLYVRVLAEELVKDEN